MPPKSAWRAGILDTLDAVVARFARKLGRCSSVQRVPKLLSSCVYPSEYGIESVGDARWRSAPWETIHMCASTHVLLRTTRTCSAKVSASTHAGTRRQSLTSNISIRSRRTEVGDAVPGTVRTRGTHRHFISNSFTVSSVDRVIPRWNWDRQRRAIGTNLVRAAGGRKRRNARFLAIVTLAALPLASWSSFPRKCPVSPLGTLVPQPGNTVVSRFALLLLDTRQRDIVSPVAVWKQWDQLTSEFVASGFCGIKVHDEARQDALQALAKHSVLCRDGFVWTGGAKRRVVSCDGLELSCRAKFAIWLRCYSSEPRNTGQGHVDPKSVF